jgi:hypothetical protein
MAEMNTSFYPQQQPNSLMQNMQGAVSVANGMQQNQLLQTTNQQSHQDLVKGQVQYLAGGLGILAKKPDLSQADMLGFAQNALKEGMISPQTYQVETANVAAAGNDPVKLQALATNYAQRALDAGQQFETTFGAPSSVNTGPSTVIGSQSALHGFTPQTSMANGMAPSDANALVSVTNPDGSTNQMTKSASVPILGGNQLTGAGPAPQQPGNALMPNQAAVPAVPSAAVPAQQAMPGVRIPSPQQTAMNLASAQQYQSAKENDVGFTANTVPLQKMIELLPKAQTGLGAETVTNLAKVASTFGLNLPGTADQAQYYSELEKYANVLARSSGAAPNSDAQLLAAMSSNPNVTMNNAAAQDVAKTMLALQRMQHAAVASAQSAKVAPEGYSDFARQWGAQQDPRAYGVDLMSPEGKQALLTQLQSNPAAKAKFINSLKIADQSGTLNPPQSANGQ